MIWLLGALEVLLSIALVLWLLTLPVLFRAYYPVLKISKHTHDAAAVVDWLSTSHRERSLNLALTDGKLGIQELKHYSDVRRVFRQFPSLLLGLALASALLIAAAGPSLGSVAAAQWRGLILLAGLLIGIGGLAWWDWPRFFALVHHPLFGDRSWRLPDDAYSLVLFPAEFWRIAVAALLLSPLLFLGLTALVIRLCGLRTASAALISSSATGFEKRTRTDAPGERMPTTP